MTEEPSRVLARRRSRAGRLFAPIFVFLGLVIFSLWMMLRTNNPIWVVLALPLGIAWVVFAIVREVRIMAGSAQARPDPPGGTNIVE